MVFAIGHTLAVPEIRQAQQRSHATSAALDRRPATTASTTSPQGNELLPYAWFLALEQPRFSFSGRSSIQKTILTCEGFGFIPDCRKRTESRTPCRSASPAMTDFVDPYTGQKSAALGLTCAACHTGELFYGGKAIRIDAGPSMLDLQKFQTALAFAVGLDVLRSAAASADLPISVLGPNPPHAAIRFCLRKALKYYSRHHGSRNSKQKLSLFPDAGRLRPHRRARSHRQFRFWDRAKQREELRRRAIGPVNFPPIWDASWMDWVQYNGSIQQPMGRNVGEALGVRSRINLAGLSRRAVSKHDPRVNNLHEIENSDRRRDASATACWSPKWPEDILGKIDPDKAAKGRGTLQPALCVHCHQCADACPTKARRSTTGRTVQTTPKDTNSSR